MADLTDELLEQLSDVSELISDGRILLPLESEDSNPDTPADNFDFSGECPVGRVGSRPYGNAHYMLLVLLDRREILVRCAEVGGFAHVLTLRDSDGMRMEGAEKVLILRQTAALDLPEGDLEDAPSFSPRRNYLVNEEALYELVEEKVQCRADTLHSLLLNVDSGAHSAFMTKLAGSLDHLRAEEEEAEAKKVF